MIETALLNTVLGMGTVFVALIFLSIVIGSLKHFNRFQGKQDEAPKKDIAPPITVNRNKTDGSTNMEKEVETDDTELISVITAAITAYQSSMGVPVSADGLVIRSIKKRNYKKY